MSEFPVPGPEPFVVRSVESSYELFRVWLRRDEE